MALVVCLQVFNISLNQSDFMLGKMGNGYVYVNEIETVVEFIVEICITGKDTIPETQVPGGSLGFEEEETHFYQKTTNFSITYNPDHLYKDHFMYQDNLIMEPVREITTPPPRA